MSTIATETGQYLTYILTETDGSRLQVVPERGGIITSWQVEGQEVLYLDADRFRDPALTVRGGIPILFPICGNLPENQYRHADRAYALKQHGFARDLPWQVTEQTTTAGTAITLELVSNDQTRAVYPFEFVVQFTYRIQGNSLTIEQRFHNSGSEVMPFSTGLHPYFQVDCKDQLEFEIPATEYLIQSNQTRHPFGGSFDFAAAEIDVAFHPVSRSTAEVIDRDRQRRLILSYEPPYHTLVFWTLQPKDFYCLEPWTAPRNAINTGEFLTELAPGDRLTTQVKLEIVPL